MGRVGGGKAGPRVALYARVSTAKEQNPALQVEELRDLAQRRGWHVMGEFVDLGQSGAKDRRPELDRMLTEVRRSRVDVVACWRFDRFARSLRHLVTAMEEFRVRGVEFVSLQDGIDTATPAGRLTFHLVGAMAEFERELIRERTRAGLAAARRRGARLGRPKVRVDVERALALRAEGLSIRKVATALGVGASTVHRALQVASLESAVAPE